MIIGLQRVIFFVQVVLSRCRSSWLAAHTSLLFTILHVPIQCSCQSVGQGHRWGELEQAGGLAKRRISWLAARNSRQRFRCCWLCCDAVLLDPTTVFPVKPLVLAVGISQIHSKRPFQEGASDLSYSHKYSPVFIIFIHTQAKTRAASR